MHLHRKRKVALTLRLQMLSVTAESFPLPTLGPRLRKLVDEFKGVHRRGFQMLRWATLHGAL